MLVGVEVNIDGVKSIIDFKLIEIVYDTNLYPELLGMNGDLTINL